MTRRERYVLETLRDGGFIWYLENKHRRGYSPHLVRGKAVLGRITHPLIASLVRHGWIASDELARGHAVAWSYDITAAGRAATASRSRAARATASPRPPRSRRG